MIKRKVQRGLLPFLLVENGLQGGSEQTELKKARIVTYEGSESIIDEVSLPTSQKSNEDSVRALPDIYKFGIGSAKNITDLPLHELLITAIDSKLLFQPTQQGKTTVQNFECYSKKGNVLSLSRQDESRVRGALTGLYEQLDQESRTILYKEKPLIGHGVVEWNQKRNETAQRIEEKLINELSIKEKEIATKLCVNIPKRVANTTGAVMSRYDDLKTNTRKYDDTLQRNQMSSFLIQASAGSSSSSSSASTGSSSSSCAAKQAIKEKKSVSSSKTKEAKK
jgi:hypothetical protein